MTPDDFQATVIEDSISTYGVRLTTFQLRYPRFIHAEFMTHRVFSRNARSSRAVPVKRLMEEAPYIPHFMKNQAGMQSFEELDKSAQEAAVFRWLNLVAHCKDTAESLGTLDVHKQWANRMLEWFGYIDVVVTSTYWKNFFNLRDHPMAMPEIQQLAIVMRDSMAASTPRLVIPKQDLPPLQQHADEWHLPYVDRLERIEHSLEKCLLISAARCARVSYKPFDADTASHDKDIQLAERLLVAEPLHASPAEHQGFPDFIGGLKFNPFWCYQENWGNFYGWAQYRKFLPNEAYQEEYSLESCLEHYNKLRAA